MKIVTRSQLIFHSILVFGLFVCSNALYCQNYPVPDGYKIFKNYEGKSQRLDKDFDNDGINDLAIVCSKKNKSNIIAIYLSTRYNTDNVYFWFPWDTDMTGFQYKSQVLLIESCFGTGRFCKTLKLKFYSNLHDMRLIGYDEQSFGNAMNEGAYLKTINLISNEYDIDGGTKRKTDLPTITLANIENYFSYLEQVGSNYLPK